MSLFSLFPPLTLSSKFLVEVRVKCIESDSGFESDACQVAGCTVVSQSVCSWHVQVWLACVLFGPHLTEDKGFTE